MNAARCCTCVCAESELGMFTHPTIKTAAKIEMYKLTENKKRIRLNIRGCRYETFQATLDEFPDTLLGSEEKRRRFYDPFKDEYYIERDKCAFDAILFYYQSRGILSRPSTISANVFDEELKFYEIPTHQTAEQEMKAEERMPVKAWQRKLWGILEYPESSKQAALFSKLSMVVIVFSIVVFCAETMDVARSLSLPNATNNASVLELVGDKAVSKRPRLWFIIDTCIIFWFCAEYISRLVSAPDKIGFIFSSLALIDLAAIIPYFLSLILGEGYAPTFSFTILRIFRLLRVVRLLKLTRYVAALRILGNTLHTCQEQLLALLFLIIISVILFSSSIYYIENEANSEQFCSIPASFWWTIITMTTVGYGDMAPITPLGRIVGTFCAVFGVVVMVCLPSPVFISSFNEIYLQYVSTLKKNEEMGTERKQETMTNGINTSNKLLQKRKHYRSTPAHKTH
ncbi:shaker-related potassium channel tsha2-like [Montipora capricornis]|uniref:shaker-related potassium channel tsha2-like n=1 Tax=Montipora capricornis TaxID=246305 RepID=UPI0035F128EC